MGITYVYTRFPSLILLSRQFYLRRNNPLPPVKNMDGVIIARDIVNLTFMCSTYNAIKTSLFGLSLLILAIWIKRRNTMLFYNNCRWNTKRFACQHETRLEYVSSHKSTGHTSTGYYINLRTSDVSNVWNQMT